ncbi:MAG TPA: PKD domain-containing protein [Thermoanaerobaculia bacterium]|nr:PKD domain-containing protein [Thermoanaerobaculia bacterium]
MTQILSPSLGQALWGVLEPADKGQLPDARDSSNYNGTQRPDDTVYRVPLFTSMDVENGWIFQTYTQGFKIWDATGANAADPQLIATRDCQGSGVTRCLPGQHELRELFWDVDAPEGNDSIVASVSAPLGIQIWDTTQKGNPRQLYQDYNRALYQVWSASIGGRNYAFAVDEGNRPGLHLYDMTAALGYTGCVDEQRPDSEGGPIVSCPNVYKGRIGASESLGYIDGLKRSDGKVFVVVSSGGNGFQIYDVTNPLAPQNISGRQLTGELVYGVALWEQNGHQFLALQYIRTRVQGGGQGARIYDVTNCLNGNCGGLTPLWTKTWAVGAARHFTTYSKSGSKHYVYFGNEDKCSGGRQREWLFDVSAVGSGGQPEELISKNLDGSAKTVTVVGKLNGPASGETAVVDYWSWYYANNPSGFSEVMPRMGKVYGDYFYRTAWTIFDVHRVTLGQPPVANFTWSPQTEIYPDTPVTFTDASSGQPTSWTWTFPGQSALPGSATQSFTFQTPGSQSVTLGVENSHGSHAVTKSLTVLNPAPAGGTLGASPSPALVCQDVNLNVSGVTGKPPLSYSWEVLNASNQVVDSGSSVGSFTWDNTGQQVAGTYTGRVTISNATGPAIQRTTSIQLNALPSLQFNTNPLSCTNCTSGAPPAGSAALAVDAQGATRWRWYWSGQDPINGTPDLETTIPVLGLAPLANFTTTGQKTVRVRISNCVDLNGVLSEPLTININQINPLVITTFAAPCNFSHCEFVVNQPVAFSAVVSGDPTLYKLDPKGDGNFITVPAPKEDGLILHTYTQTTSSPICPKLRIERGAEVKEQAVTTCFNVVQGGPQLSPSISVDGASTGQANQALSFNASANNCTPSANWNWIASGSGSVSGSGSSVTITWSTEGNKTVSVTNSGCSGASGSKSVTIGGGTPVNPGSLSANFSFTPASPAAGQAVSFNGGSSTGAPSIYSWTFGDGQTGSGAAVSHTYPNAGTYNVRLEVTKAGGDCPFGFCSASITKQVVVGNGGPPPLVATFTSPNCVTDFGINSCSASRNETVTFTSTTSGATTQSWSFGDGGTATGGQATHAWSQSGTYQVQLTVGNGQSTASAAVNIVITGNGDPEPPPAGRKSVLLPWIAQTRGALVQSSDLYIFNPTTKAMDVTVQFLRRGFQPEANPPRVTRTIQPGATLFVADVLDGLFNRTNIAGFITVEVAQGDAEPVITSFNTTIQTDGSRFGQTVPGMSLSQTGTAAQSGPIVQHLIGLNDNSENFAYFGISNPADQDGVFKLRFYDRHGALMTQSGNITVPRFGQRQYQVQNIRDQFHISDEDDYRIEVETQGGGTLFPYGATVRTASSDPSFVEAGRPAASSKAYLVGIFGTAGIGGSEWQSDLVITNPANEVVIADMRFIPAGTQSDPTDKVTLTLQPRETRRISNVLSSQWGLTSAVGTLSFESNSPSGTYPLIRAEVYDNARPDRRFGQAMSAYLTDDAAGNGKSQYLVGMRQDTTYRSTLTLYNPGTESATFDVIYRLLDGSVIGTLSNQTLGGNRVRQLNPGQHPLPQVGVDGGITIEIKVKAGKVLASGQVVNNRTNDPAYIGGRTR